MERLKNFYAWNNHEYNNKLGKCLQGHELYMENLYKFENIKPQ